MSNSSYNVSHCAIVILAAGSSSRLGSPKQLLTYGGKSLVQHAVDTALATFLRPVIVVTGAHRDAVSTGLENRAVMIATNAAWAEGMASSLRLGLAVAQQTDPEIDGIIFMVCDQPYVTPALLEELLLTQRKTGKPAVASSYQNRKGTPALWHQSLFNVLMQLQGDTGARSLIQQYEEQVATVAFEKGMIDIDTMEDYEKFLNTNNEHGTRNIEH